MATAKELDAQWEAQYQVVLQKRQELTAAQKALVASPAYQNGSEAERAELAKSGPGEQARLAFNAENQKLTALKYQLDDAIAAEKKAEEDKAKEKPAEAPPPENKNDTAGGEVEAQQGTTQEAPLSAAESARLKNANGDEPDPNGEYRGEDPVTKTNNSILRAIDAVPAEKKKQEVTPGAASKIVVVPNPLHAYSSYTYGLSWHMLTKDDFNTMAQDPKGDWKPGHTLVASAGKYGGTDSGFERDDNFLDDFYFDNFKMTSIIGSQAGNAGTNAVELSFTLIEPYGITLIDRMIDACLNEVDGKNYLEIPYLLVINFYGYDDEGIGSHIVSQRKYIPIKLISMGIKAGIKGAEYSITAVPFAHSGFQESVAAVPANFEVKASTLQDFFKDDATVDARVKSSFNQRQESQAKAAEAAASAQSDGAQTRESDVEKSKKGILAPSEEDSGYTVASFTSAYNSWQELTVKNNNATDFNTISVKFDKAILEAFNGEGGKIVEEKAQQKTQVAEKNPTVKKERAQTVQADAGKPTGQPDFKVSKWNVRGGDSITTVINNVMINSNYIRKQVIDPTKGVEQNAEELGKEGKDLLWWKIIPSVQMRKFCTQTSRWYMDITYNVISYKVNNRTHPNAPKSMPTGWHKDYQYLYTGQNNDIIDFSIEFDTAFYTAVSVDRGKNQSVTTTPGKEEDRLNEQAPGKGDDKAAQSAVTPAKKVAVGEQANITVGGNTKKDSKAVAAASLAAQQNGGGGADQLSVRLKIVGDPQFIKQDDVYYTPAAREYVDGESAYGQGSVGSEDGSIAMDGGEIHVRLSWRTPTDIDEETGFMRQDTRYTTSAFSGIYRVISVESILTQGKFEQTLELIRLPDQPNDYGSSGNSSADIRKDVPPALSANNNNEGYKAVDSNNASNSVEAQKTKVMTDLMSQNKTAAGDDNSNRGKVEDAAEVEENVDPQTNKLKDVVQNGETEAISDQAPDSPTVATGTVDTVDNTAAEPAPVSAAPAPSETKDPLLVTYEKAEEDRKAADAAWTAARGSVFSKEKRLNEFISYGDVPAERLAQQQQLVNEAKAEAARTRQVYQDSVAKSEAALEELGAVPTPAASANIPRDQVVSNPNYTSVYQAAIANNTPPLLAAKQASEAAKSAIILGN